jgi:hypothetical protein
MTKVEVYITLDRKKGFSNKKEIRAYREVLLDQKHPALTTQAYH